MAKGFERPVVETGSNILAFSNEFEIASRNEPMSVQRGVIASYSKLYGRLGIHEASFTGNVYVIDAITNNPGIGGGVALRFQQGRTAGHHRQGAATHLDQHLDQLCLADRHEG